MRSFWRRKPGSALNGWPQPSAAIPFFAFARLCVPEGPRRKFRYFRAPRIFMPRDTCPRRATSHVVPTPRATRESVTLWTLPQVSPGPYPYSFHLAHMRSGERSPALPACPGPATAGLLAAFMHVGTPRHPQWPGDFWSQQPASRLGLCPRGGSHCAHHARAPAALAASALALLARQPRLRPLRSLCSRASRACDLCVRFAYAPAALATSALTSLTRQPRLRPLRSLRSRASRTGGLCARLARASAALAASALALLARQPRLRPLRSPCSRASRACDLCVRFAHAPAAPAASALASARAPAAPSPHPPGEQCSLAALRAAPSHMSCYAACRSVLLQTACSRPSTTSSSNAPSASGRPAKGRPAVG